MASNRKKIKEEVHFNIIRLLDENLEISTRGIARIVGVSNGGAYYYLTALIEKGFIKLENFRSSHDKRRYTYILTPRGIKEKALLTSRFLKAKVAEYDELKREIKELQQDMERTDNNDNP